MSAQLACMVADVPAGTALKVDLEGPDGPVEVAVVCDDDGRIHAISDICSHGQVSLSQGEVDGCRIPDLSPASTYSFIAAASLSLWCRSGRAGGGAMPGCNAMACSTPRLRGTPGFGSPKTEPANSFSSGATSR